MHALPSEGVMLLSDCIQLDVRVRAAVQYVSSGRLADPGHLYT